MENTEKYLNEMLDMKKRAVKPQSSSGKLQVFVTALRGYYPIKNAFVRVFTGSGENEVTVAKGTTDQSGKTAVFVLPAPDVKYSLDRESTVLPYSLYNVSVNADGFIGQRLMNLPIFSGVTSLQRVNLLHISAKESLEKQTEEEYFPDFNL